MRDINLELPEVSQMQKISPVWFEVEEGAMLELKLQNPSHEGHRRVEGISSYAGQEKPERWHGGKKRAIWKRSATNGVLGRSWEEARIRRGDLGREFKQKIASNWNSIYQETPLPEDWEFHEPR